MPMKVQTFLQKLHFALFCQANFDKFFDGISSHAGTELFLFSKLLLLCMMHPMAL